MNCNLTDEDRKKGMRCRSWDCYKCLEFNTSKNDLSIIKTHMQNMALREEIQQLKQQLSLMGCEFAEYEKTKKELLGATDKLGAVLVKMEGENPNYQSIYNELFEMWEALRK